MVAKAHITIQDFVDLVERYPDKHFDLTAEGEVIEVSPKLLHGLIQARIAYLISVYLRSTPALSGYGVATEVAHQLGDWPCRPDVSINGLSDEQIPTTAPLLAVEIKSDANTYTDLRAKARKYIEHGTKMVWLAYPEKQIVEVYQPDADDQLLTLTDTLDGGAALPGFSVPVRELFG